MSEMQQNSVSTRPVPEPPRPLTAKARKRAMMEPIARSWAILTAIIFVTLIGVTIQGITQWRSDKRMVEGNATVKAVGYAEGAKIKGRPLPIGVTIYIEYEYQGKKYSSQGPLVRTDKQYVAGEPFEIRLDPDEPTVWTNRQVPLTLREKMIGSIMTSIFFVFSAAVTLVMRQLSLSLWRNGDLREGRVMEHRQSALAPRSVGLYCAVRQEKQEHLLTVYVPQASAVPVGQNVTLLTNATATRAIALMNYHA